MDTAQAQVDIEPGMTEPASPPGYDYGSAGVGTSPVSRSDFEDLKRIVRFEPEDARYLHLAGEILKDQVGGLLDYWFGQIGSFVQATFTGPDAERYSTTAGARFARGIVDALLRPYDQDWLNYQHEVGLRHHRTKKNQTDRVESVPVVPFRYLVGSMYLISQIPASMFEGRIASRDDITKIQQAWAKSVTLQVGLWSHAYVKDGDW